MNGAQEENEEFNKEELQVQQCGRNETQVQKGMARKIILDMGTAKGP